ncbi:uncharacterized protein LOC141679134 [Apium graveolens]|uniref:uncharacterized protein LOC141679134 n=1 Tax=Apium graveolens TaxID=4045 RepID=UPI003D7A3CC5
MQPLPSIAQTYRLFAQEERHKEISAASTASDSMAFYADRKKFNPSYQINRNVASNTGSNANWKKNGDQGFTRKPAYFCNHCKIPGHSMERCFKLNGYPPGFQDRQNRKFAAMTLQTPRQDYSENSATEEMNRNSETVTKEQYNHLLNLINQKNNNTTGPSDSDDGKHALLAGPFLEKASDSTW